MMTIWMDKVPEFAEHFRQYGFDWMIRAQGIYSKVLVWEFYTAYKGELMRLYPQGNGKEANLSPS